MNTTLWTILFTLLAVIQLAGMIWACRWTDYAGINIFVRLALIVFWPVTFLAACFRIVQ